MAENSASPSITQLVRNPYLLLAFGFGSGLSPVVPGTMGTVVAVLIYMGMSVLPLWVYVLLTVLSFVVGIYLCGYASKALGVHDHKGIVWDEFSGYWISMIAVPFSWQYTLLGFVVFRFFDMVKPWPISLADKKIHGGFGIMFDDVLAGVATCLCIHGLIMAGII